MKKQKKKKVKQKRPIMTKHIVIGLSIFLVAVFIFTGISVQDILNKTKPIRRITVEVTPTTIPTIDISLANTFKTYTSNIYGFSVTYPALGEDVHGNIISCGNNIKKFFTRQPTTIPTIRIDGFYQVTVHPWGAQLHDYLLQQDKNIFRTTPFYWTGAPNIDEAVIFTTKDTQGYFKDVLALYKKGNLIYQVEKPQSLIAGCQMLFDPRDYNQTPLAKNQSAPYQSLLLEQYRSWNEVTSIVFNK